MKYEHPLPSTQQVRRRRATGELRQRLVMVAGPNVKNPFEQHRRLTLAIKGASRRARRLLKSKPFHRRDLLRDASIARDAFMKRRLKVWYRIMKEIAPLPVRERPESGAYGAHFDPADYPAFAAGRPDAPAFGEQPSAAFMAYHKRMKKLRKFLWVVRHAFNTDSRVHYDSKEILQLHDGVVMSETNNSNTPLEVMQDWLHEVYLHALDEYSWGHYILHPPPAPIPDEDNGGWQQFPAAMETQMDQSFVPHNLQLHDIAVVDVCPEPEPGTDPDNNRCPLCQEPFIPGYKPVKSEIKQELGVKDELVPTANQQDSNTCVRLKCGCSYRFHEMCIDEYLHKSVNPVFKCPVCNFQFNKEVPSA
jgi:hypothetical protein